MQLGNSLKGHVHQLVGATGGIAAHYTEGASERIVLMWAWLDDNNIVGLVEHQNSVVSAEIGVPGFDSYVGFDGGRR